MLHQRKKHLPMGCFLFSPLEVSRDPCYNKRKQIRKEAPTSHFTHDELIRPNGNFPTRPFSAMPTIAQTTFQFNITRRSIMFSSGHFIWLGAIALAILATFVFVKHRKPSHKTVQFAVTALLIVMKLLHYSLSMEESSDGGLVISQTQLSFHLCSIQIYLVVFMNFIKDEIRLSKLKSFMVPCMLIGAAMALFIPTAGVNAAEIGVWEYMVAHGVLVYYGLYLMAIEKVDLGLKAYFNNLLFLTATTLFAFIMNSILVDANANYFFLRKPPMDGLPILNLDNGWYAYIVTLIAVACILIFLIQLPFIIKEQKAKKKDK